MKSLNKVTNINFLEETPDHAVIFTCDYAEIDVPQDYFDKGIAEMIGKDVNMFGLFEIKVYEAGIEEDEITERTPFKPYFFKHKGMIYCSPSVIKEKRDPSTGEKILTLVFRNGDKFIKNTTIAVNNEVASTMLDLMTLGYLPPVFPYEDIAQYWSDVNTFNGIKVGSMSQASIELIVSEVARDPKNLSRTFRAKLRDNPNINRNDWKLINIREIPKYTSVFASIGAGDPKSSIISQIARQRDGESQKDSPVEDAIL